MGLWARISPEAEDRIAVHRLAASVGEYLRGNLTSQQVQDAFNFSVAEKNELNTILARITSGDISPQHVKDVLMLVELGDYPEAKAKLSLGY